MEELKEIANAIKVVKDNSGGLTLGGIGSMVAIVAALAKVHKKFVSDPMKALSDKLEKTDTRLLKGLDKLSRKVDKEDDKRLNDLRSNENRIKEIDQLLEYQDKRIETLEEEDKEVLKTIGNVKLDIDRIRSAIEGSNIDISELKASWRELRDLDTQRQVAIGKVETILAMI